MRLENVYDRGYMSQEFLSTYAGMGSNKAIDTRGNIYEKDPILNRWEKSPEKTNKS
jgi:hypothetical protein